MRRRAALHALIATVATWPLVLDPLRRLVGHEDIDVWNHAWGPFWFWRSLRTGALPWHTDLLFAPRGGVLWYIDPVGAVAGMGLVPLFGVVAAYNAVIFGLVALASVAGRRLSLALGASEGSAWVGAVALATSPYLLSEVHNGISEAVGLAWGAFALNAALRAEGPRAWAGVGLWLAFTTLGTWYYGFSACLTVAGIALLRRQLRGLGVAAAVTGALAVPFLALIQRSVAAPDALVSRTALKPWDWDRILSHNAVDPRAFLWPGDFQSVDLASRGEAFLHSSYLGLVALPLALSAPARRFLLAALPAAALSLGVYLWYDGAWVEWKPNGRWLLPFGALIELFPSAGSTHAQRFVAPALALVAGLAGAGTARLGRGVIFAAALVLADQLWNAPWPLPRAPALDGAAHTALRGGEGIVLDLPGEVGMSMATSRYLVYQAFSERPIPYRPDARANTAAFLGRGWFSRLRAADAPTAQLRASLLEEAARNEEEPRRAMKAAGVGAIVLHPELDRGSGAVEELRGVLEGWLGPGRRVGTHELWEL